MNSKSKAIHAATTAALLFTTPQLEAQSISRDIAAANDSAQRRVPMLTRTDAVGVLGVSAVVLALMPNDRSIAAAFQRSSVQSNSTLKGASNGFDAAADPGVLVFSAATHFLGLAKHSLPVASLGMHTGEAIVLGGVISEVMKGSFGRARPSVSPTDPRDFHSGRGFGNDDFGSFPSAETTIAFAAATAASREVGRSWPGASRYVTPASYGAATLVGFARLYKNQHWASDVAAGAGVGTMSGILFDRYNRKYPSNIFNRVFLPRSVLPDHRRLTVEWLLPLQ
ncbi:MAG TPA: phosphatase PAP2 family protein [Gemmatimonadaceae bacterium]|jgi:membrane-associated phospholipid phosphatase